MSGRVFRVSIILIVISLAWVAVAYAEPDIHRFDRLLKTSWYGVHMSTGSSGQNAKIGYMKISLERIDEPVNGWKMISALNMSMAAGTERMSVSIEDVRTYSSPKAELYSSRLVMTSPTGDIEVNGEAAGENFVLKTVIGGQTTEKSLSFPLDYLDSVLCIEMRALTGRLAVGDTFSFSMFEATPPLTGLIHQSVKISGKEDYLFNGVPTEVFVANVTIAEANITTQTKIDRFGDMLKGSIGGAMTLKLEDEATAKELDESFDILSDNIVKVSGAFGQPGKIKKLTLRISGIDTSGVLTTNMQQVVSVADSAFMLGITGQKAPSNAPKLPMKSDELNEYLSNEPYLQSDDPKIINLARQIVGGEKDSWAAAWKINRWVYENIEKSFTPDLSNALQTLSSRRGDCGEHTALAVALMRAAGIPARPIVGLIYWPPGHGFGYHAWVETYVGEWIQMDPAWGEDLANPARIAIARGDIIAQVGALYKIMGRINIEVVETE